MRKSDDEEAEEGFYKYKKLMEDKLVDRLLAEKKAGYCKQCQQQLGESKTECGWCKFGTDWEA